VTWVGVVYLIEEGPDFRKKDACGKGMSGEKVKGKKKSCIVQIRSINSKRGMNTSKSCSLVIKSL
jgi:hypothetical protein